MNNYTVQPSETSITTTTTVITTSNASNTESIIDFESKLISMLLSIIIIVGIIGNTLNIIVFSKKSMRQISTFRFLLYLSAADMLVLLVCSTDALLRFGYQVEIRLYSTVVCRLHTFSTYFLTHISSVILMVISVDRALVISNKTISSLFLKRKPKLEKRRRAIVECEPSAWASRRNTMYEVKSRFHRVDLVISFIVIILTLLNCHYFIFLNLNLIREENENEHDVSNSTANTLDVLNSTRSDNNNIENTKPGKESQISNDSFYICFPLEGTNYNLFLINIWTWIDICVFSLIPFVVMSICSVIILVRIRRKSQKYFKILINKNSQVNKNNFVKRLRRNRQLLYMLLITNLYFLSSLLPYCISFVLFKGQKSENTLGQLSVHILMYTNNAINFIFYGLSSQKYREELYLLCFNANKSKNRESIKAKSLIKNLRHIKREDDKLNGLNRTLRRDNDLRESKIARKNSKTFAILNSPSMMNNSFNEHPIESCISLNDIKTMNGQICLVVDISPFNTVLV